MRHAAIVLVSVLAGAAITVIVAWASALTVDPWAARDEVGFVSSNGEMWEVTTFAKPGALSVFSSRSRLESTEDVRVGEHPSVLIPKWSPFVNPTPSFVAGESRFENRGAEARGWPLLALWYETSRGPENLTFSGGIPAGSWPPGTLGSKPIPRALPLRPILAGFLADTAVFASILGLSFIAITSAHRAIRSRRKSGSAEPT